MVAVLATREWAEDVEVGHTGPQSAPRTARRRSVKGVALLGLGMMVTLLIAGNLAILSMSLWARSSVEQPAAPAVQGIKNFRAVDAKLFRGAAPGREGYESLAAAGVTTIVDLRAEENLEIDVALLERLGIRRVALPIRDGQAPTTGEVERFLAVVDQADGKVFVHCGAGVGRTGAMAASYLVATGMKPSEALMRNLAVGPPSLEQVAYAADLEDGEFERPGVVLTAVSRTLDAPRRLWSRYGF